MDPSPNGGRISGGVLCGSLDFGSGLWCVDINSSRRCAMKSGVAGGRGKVVEDVWVRMWDGILKNELY